MHIKIEDESHLLLYSRLLHLVGGYLFQRQSRPLYECIWPRTTLHPVTSCPLPRGGHILFENSRGSQLFSTRRADPLPSRCSSWRYRHGPSLPVHQSRAVGGPFSDYKPPYSPLKWSLEGKRVGSQWPPNFMLNSITMGPSLRYKHQIAWAH